MRVLTFFSLLAAACCAQDMASMMPKPAAELKPLTDMIGTWDVEESHEPSPWMPQASKGKGVATVTKGPGGLSVITEYKSTAGPLPSFHGHGISTWDANEKVYKTVWTDVMTPGIVVSTGRKEGEQLIYNSQVQMGPQKLAVREVVSDITPTSFTSTTYIVDKKVMTLVYRRRT
jgi:hypothetical protein